MFWGWGQHDTARRRHPAASGLAADNGRITGTPSASGTVATTITATDLTGAQQLYDLTVDPLENTNLLNSGTDVSAILSELEAARDAIR